MFVPLAVRTVPSSGLNVRSPLMAMAMTISGEARKALVSGLPSLRPAKLRLKDSMMELGVLSPLRLPIVRFHWPMQGPQAVARTVAWSFSKTSRTPSRLSVS